MTPWTFAFLQWQMYLFYLMVATQPKVLDDSAAGSPFSGHVEAINDTAKVQRTMSRVVEPAAPVSTQADLKSLADVKKVSKCAIMLVFIWIYETCRTSWLTFMRLGNTSHAFSCGLGTSFINFIKKDRTNYTGSIYIKFSVDYL